MKKKRRSQPKKKNLNCNNSNACQHCFQPSPFPMYLHYLSQRNSTAQRRTLIHYHPRQMHGLLSPAARSCGDAVQLVNPPCQLYRKAKYDSRVSARLLLHQPLLPTSKAIASGDFAAEDGSNANPTSVPIELVSLGNKRRLPPRHLLSFLFSF